MVGSVDIAIMIKDTLWLSCDVIELVAPTTGVDPTLINDDVWCRCVWRFNPLPDNEEMPLLGSEIFVQVVDGDGE